MVKSSPGVTPKPRSGPNLDSTVWSRVLESCGRLLCERLSREMQVVGVERLQGEEQQHHLQGKRRMSR